MNRADTRGRAPSGPLRLMLAGLIAAIAFAGLVSLGIWQIHRRAWKLDLIARVDARVHAQPVDAPGIGLWPRINRQDDEYQRVRAGGQWLAGKDTLVRASTALGSGYWVMTPLRTTDGAVILVNRGFVPPEWRTATTHPALPDGPVEVTGLLRMSEPGGGFLHSNDPAHGRWYSRDVAAIARQYGLTETAPYFIDMDASARPGNGPAGGLTVISFPNNHLVYALTWFGLAALVAGGAGLMVRDEWRARNSPANRG